MSKSNQEIIVEFIAAWSNLNPQELASYFTEDGTYHNMPIDPISGRDNVEKFITGFIAQWTSTQWDIISIISSGNTVIAERLDKTQIDGKPVSLPCTGVFEMEDGKIKIWRDYFDMQTYVNALQA